MPILLLLAVLGLVPIPGGSAHAATRFTEVEHSTSNQETAVWAGDFPPPPSAIEPAMIVQTNNPNGSTDLRITGGQSDFERFAPGLSQYFATIAIVDSFGRADYGVLRGWSYSLAQVFPTAYGPGFVQGTNPYWALANTYVRPRFLDIVIPPATVGAPNMGDSIALTMQVHLGGSVSGGTWMIESSVTREATAESLFYFFSHTSGCGGPCSFPFTTTPIDVAAKVGERLVVYASLGLSAQSSFANATVSNGKTERFINAISTASFLLKVKETGDGLVGESGHDYGMEPAATDLTLPSTTSTTEPPFPTTSTSTTTLPGATTTTTTTLPSSAEQCGGCVDEDGDGLVDFDDPDCCAGDPAALAVRKLRLAPHGDTASLALTSTIPGGTLDPSADGLVVQMRDAGGTLLCAHLPKGSFVSKKKGKRFGYRDKAGSVQGFTKANVQATGGVSLGGRSLPLSLPVGPALGVTIALPNGAAPGRCATASLALRAKGKGALIYP